MEESPQVDEEDGSCPILCISCVSAVGQHRRAGDLTFTEHLLCTVESKDEQDTVLVQEVFGQAKR